MDLFGDHASCCASAGLYRRHNRVRNLLHTLAADAGWQPELEQPVPGSNRRSADVKLNSADRATVALDVTIVHPLRPSYTSIAARETPGVSATLAEQAKDADSKAICASAHWLFWPFAMETTGALGPNASKVLKHLQRCLAMKWGIPFTDVANHTCQALHLALAKGRGEMLVSSTRGLPC